MPVGQGLKIGLAPRRSVQALQARAPEPLGPLPALPSLCQCQLAQRPCRPRKWSGQGVALWRCTGNASGQARLTEAYLCEDTDMYSPHAMLSAPPTRPASPARTNRCRWSVPPPTPSIKEAVDTKPSLAPRTPALSQGALCEKCLCSSGISSTSSSCAAREGEGGDCGAPGP